MKKVFLFIISLYTTQIIFAQQTVETIRKQAMATAQQQDFTGAIQILEQGLQQYPNNTDILKDEAYIAYLGRDYSKAQDIGKNLVEKDDADVQSYQVLGMTYKAIAAYKDGDKLYKTGLKKFPKSGVLYSEYGDMLMQYDNKRGAIEQWEKGIAADANYSSNYYFASKYYAENNNILWSSIYAEIFVNIESLTKRTAEIKTLLLNDYKKLLNNQSNLDALKNGGSEFEKAVATSMLAAVETETGNISPEMITSFRTRFLLSWSNSNDNNYPYKVFDYGLQLLREGMFDAYNQWLFGSTINKNKFDTWVYTHDEEMQNFTQLQKNVLFKVPVQQYYGNN